ncbi:MAG TPA: RNA polymerase factor sigma-54 [Steroidobacteraceae bacterium]|nr:RNA polymerase factor sigma-54 [Steroidobacteraceae bacterium]
MLKPALQLRLGQQLTMTPQLQQAIRLLQLPVLELQAQIREALEANVMLEAEEEDTVLESLGASNDEPAFDTDTTAESSDESVRAHHDAHVEVVADSNWTESHTVGVSDSPWNNDEDEDRGQEFTDANGTTLQDHLMWQLQLSKLNERDQKIGEAIIDAMNHDGYLIEPLEEIALNLMPELTVQPAEVESILKVIQNMDPAGVGARNVSECIALQLQQLQADTPGLNTALQIATHYLDEVAHHQYSLIRKQLHASEEDLEQALALVRACQPRPGASIHSSAPDYIVPDVFVRRTEHGWSVEINPASVPRIRVNQSYAGLLGRSSDFAAMRTQLQEARWLIRSLEIRNETLLKVARCIVQRQTAFLEQGDEAMQPMILKDVADAVEMHESTISRVTTNKYMHTPRGVFEFRYFFSSHVSGSDGSELSSTAIRAKIRKLVAAEEPDKPLSDSRIAEILSGDGIQVARRTVAKYREALGIPPSSERKRVTVK